MARAAGRPLSGELRLGVIPTIAPVLLPKVLPPMRAKWPDLKLYLREETSPHACESLSRGNLDCVLLALPYHCGDVDSSVLFQDRLFVSVPGNQADSLGASIPAETAEPDRLTSEAPSVRTGCAS